MGCNISCRMQTKQQIQFKQLDICCPAYIVLQLLATCADLEF